MLTKNCACKGIRTCLVCDPARLAENDALTTSSAQNDQLVEFIYCWKCANKAYLPTSFDDHNCDDVSPSIPGNENDQMILIDGVFLQPDVLTEGEEAKLCRNIDSFTWIDSQSGRRKQDFGPKINFKKKKINFTSFDGLPDLDIRLLEDIKRTKLPDDCAHSIRFESSNSSNSSISTDLSKNILRNFKTVEVCHLEYCPERGSSIDPHFDDFWIWGERLVTLNLLSATVVTLTRKTNEEETNENSFFSHCVRIKLPPRSLLVLYGDSRYRYQHSIRRSDIVSRRLAVTYRELPANFLRPGTEEFETIGKKFIEQAEKLIAV